MTIHRDRSSDRMSWRVAVYGAALLGGILWGLVAAFTVGAPGDQARHDAVDGHRLGIAAVVSVVLIAAGAAIIAWGRVRASAPGGRVLGGTGWALITGPLGGWLVLASLVLQGHSMRGV